MIKNYQKIIRSSNCIFIMIFFLIFLFKCQKQNKIKAVENKAIQSSSSMTSQEIREKLNKQNHKIYTNKDNNKIIYHCHKIKYEIYPIQEGNIFYVQFLYDKQLLNDKWRLQGKENQKYSIGKTFYHYTNNHSDYKIEFRGDWFLK